MAQKPTVQQSAASPNEGSASPPTSPLSEGAQPASPDRSGIHAYNIVADTAVGVNVRWRDNLYQGIAIFACLVIGVVAGLLFARDRLAGLFFGAVGGLLVGLFGSGIFLMIFRATRHLQGRHD